MQWNTSINGVFSENCRCEARGYLTSGSVNPLMVSEFGLAHETRGAAHPSACITNVRSYIDVSGSSRPTLVVPAIKLPPDVLKRFPFGGSRMMEYQDHRVITQTISNTRDLVNWTIDSGVTALSHMVVFAHAATTNPMQQFTNNSGAIAPNTGSNPWLSFMNEEPFVNSFVAFRDVQVSVGNKPMRVQMSVTPLDVWWQEQQTRFVLSSKDDVIETGAYTYQDHQFGRVPLFVDFTSTPQVMAMSQTEPVSLNLSCRLVETLPCLPGQVDADYPVMLTCLLFSRKTVRLQQDVSELRVLV